MQDAPDPDAAESRQQLRRVRRQTRQAVRVRDWPWRRKVAFGAWVPVAIVGFFLFTGPNGSPSGATTDLNSRPKTVTTVKAPLPKPSLKQFLQRIAAIRQTQKDVSYWAAATPTRLTLQQQQDKARWRADRRKQLLQQHKAAVASSHHRDQKTP